MRKIVDKKFNKKHLSIILAGVITLTSIAGCNAKTNTSETTTTAPTTAPTTSETTNETTIPAAASEFQASEEYMNYAKAIAAAMYDANKEYFDEKQFSQEDLENVIYVLNNKYYDNEGNIIMDAPELDESFDIIRELVCPQRINEMLQKYRDVEHGNLSYEEYMNEVNASVFYDYNNSLSNFIIADDNNKDVVYFVDDFSQEMIKVTENVKNCVSPEEHMIEFFGKVRSAQTGDLTEYKNINNYLQDNYGNDGYGFIVAGIYKSTADLLNTVVDGQYVTVQNEEVRVGFSYDERMLVNAYYLGDLVDYDVIYKAQRLENELFQTMPLKVMCDKQVKITDNFGYEPVKAKTKTKTL